MGIFSRLSDIIGANINAALDRAEDPEKMIRQMISEMEDTLVEARSSAARLIADRKDMQRRISRIGEAEAEWQRKAELAVSRDREDLARAALAEKSKLADDHKNLDEELSLLADELDKFEADIAKLEERLAETRAKQKALTARHTTAKQRIKVRKSTDDRRIEEAFVRFEMMERRLDRMHGELEARDLGQKPDLATEIDQLEAATAVEEELAAIRARLGKTPPPAGQ